MGNRYMQTLAKLPIVSPRIKSMVTINGNGSELMISAEDLDFSNEANERLSCEHDGEDLEIGFNAKFLVEMLANIDSDEITLRLSAPNKAGIITPNEKDDEEDILMLVMPVMLNNQV